VRCIIALLLATALLSAANPQYPAAAFFWDATHVAVVVGHTFDTAPPNATKIPDPNLRPPFGEMFTLPGVSNSDGVDTGENFDINLTTNFWVRATVDGFLYNKTEYSAWTLATATINPDDQQRYAAATKAKLYVFLAEPAQPGRISDAGQIRNPVMHRELPASARAALEANLNQIMVTKLREAIRKEQTAARDDRLSSLLNGKAKLSIDVDDVDLGPPLGVRQHVSGTWTIGDDIVFSLQGWEPPETNRIESVEAIDGMPEDKAYILPAVDDWAEESLDDFTIENVFAGGRLLRYSAGYESSTIYLERITSKGREFERTLYEL
jgi:hypothetical protein